jgi:hypothetical protein
MKLNFTLLFLIIFSLIPFQKIIAQNFNVAGGGEYKFNESKTPCLTDVQRAEVMADVKNGIQEL